MNFFSPHNRNEMLSLGDTAISLHILQAPRGGGVGLKVRFGLGEENWSLEILGVGGGGCSAKCLIWTRGRKLEFGNFWGRGVLPNVRFGLGEENWSLEIGGGVFCQRSDLDLGKKIRVWKFWGVFCQKSDSNLGKKIGV